MLKRHDFPTGFVWGTATAAYQIEGAARDDGRGPSIWDTFSHTPGRVRNNDSGDVACDHYRRWPEDLDLMRRMNLGAYRFSIAWPRVLPEGRGRPNERGLAFYDRLVDGLLERGIEPWATLYHWDLPQALQNAGGWAERATAQAFADYAELVAGRLGDRVKRWITHNEPWCAAILGNLAGIHAPGLRDAATAYRVAHNLLVSHGLAVPRVRAASAGASVGITLNLVPAYPASDRPEDLAAAERHDLAQNRLFLDPLYGRGYPPALLDLLGDDAPSPEPGDLELIAAPTDFLGVNYYSRAVVAHDPNGGPLRTRQLRPEASEYTAFDWEVFPRGLTDLLVRVGQDYPTGPILVTENGAAYHDRLEGGRVHDEERRTYLERHLAACLDAVRAGAPLAGYFAWSLLDNFEWAEGYDKRFGLTHVDFGTQARTLKYSGEWYRDFLADVPAAAD